MRRTTKLGIVTSVVSIAGVVACNGGTGAVSISNDGWDSDRGNLSERERPVGGTVDPATNSAQPSDQLPDSKDNAPVTGGGTGGGVFVCAGIYECLLSGRSETCTTTRDGERNCTPGQVVNIRVRIELKESNGVCFIGEARLEPNGTLRGDDADEVGTWTRQGNGIFINAGETSGLCVPSSGPVGLVGDDGKVVSGTGSSSSSSSTSSTSSSSGNDDISIDPGTGQDESSSSGSSGG